MVKAKTFLATASLFLLAVFALPQAAQARGTESGADMTGAELRALLAEGLQLKLGGQGEDYAGVVTLKPNGTGEGKAIFIDGRTFQVSGTWSIEGDRFCRQWKYDNFEKACETWRRIDQNRVEVFLDGKRIGVNSW